MNRRLLISSIAFICIIMVACIGIQFYLKIDEPVFMRSYCDVQVPDETGMGLTEVLQLEYITNQSDTRKIVGISFLEAPELAFYVGSDDLFFEFDNTEDPNVTTYGPYHLHQVRLNINGGLPEEYQDGLIVSKAVIAYDNGDTQTVDLGQIALSVKNDDYVNELHSTIGWDWESTEMESFLSKFSLRYDVSIISITSHLMETLNQNIGSCLVNGEDYSKAVGAVVPANQEICFSVEYPMKDEALRFELFHPVFLIQMQDTQGTVSNWYVNEIGYKKPISDLHDILTYLKARGAI